MPCLIWRALASFASSAAISASMSERMAAMAVLFGFESVEAALESANLAPLIFADFPSTAAATNL